MRTAFGIPIPNAFANAFGMDRGLGNARGGTGNARGTDSGHFRENPVRAFSANIGFLYKCPALLAKPELRVIFRLIGTWSFTLKCQIYFLIIRKIEICWPPTGRPLVCGHVSFSDDIFGLRIFTNEKVPLLLLKNDKT